MYTQLNGHWPIQFHIQFQMGHCVCVSRYLSHSVNRGAFPYMEMLGVTFKDMMQHCYIHIAGNES